MDKVHITGEFSSENIHFSFALILNPTVTMAVKCNYK